MPSTQRLQLRFPIERDTTSFDGPFDCANQYILRNRLCQELHCTGLHGFHRHRHVGVAGDENDRRVAPLARDQRLQLEPIETWKRDIEYQAIRYQNPGMSEKVLCRYE